MLTTSGDRPLPLFCQVCTLCYNIFCYFHIHLSAFDPNTVLINGVGGSWSHNRDTRDADRFGEGDLSKNLTPTPIPCFRCPHYKLICGVLTGYIAPVREYGYQIQQEQALQLPRWRRFNRADYLYPKECHSLFDVISYSL